jgi:cell division protein FtsB
MYQKLKDIFGSTRFQQLSDPRNIGLYIFGFMTLLITWSGVTTIQTNYELQKKIAGLQQQNEVHKLENENLKLKNKYLETDQFLELEARKQFGKAAPGERVFIIPKTVALSHVTQDPPPIAEVPPPPKTKTQQNLDAWKQFMSGHQNLQ